VSNFAIMFKVVRRLSRKRVGRFNIIIVCLARVRLVRVLLERELQSVFGIVFLVSFVLFVSQCVQVRV
jgi:hypothetical protein